MNCAKVFPSPIVLKGFHIYSPGKSQTNLGKTMHMKEFQPTFLSPPKTAPFPHFSRLTQVT